MTCWLQKYLIAYYRIVDKAKIIRNSFFGISRDTILVPQSKLFASPRASDHQSFKYMSRDSLKRVVGDILSHNRVEVRLLVRLTRGCVFPPVRISCPPNRAKKKSLVPRAP